MVLTKLRVLKRQVKNSEYDDDEVWIGFQDESLNCGISFIMILPVNRS
jgi:hypothetical protein